MKASTLAHYERMVRPLLTVLHPRRVVNIYSSGRLKFLERLKEEKSYEVYNPPESKAKTLWGIHFRSPIMNAAGMFKNGECYELMVRQGVGAYLGGTGTWNSRPGNEKEGIKLPFVPYPRSHSSSNFLGLPNDGDEINAERAAKLGRIFGAPIGWSVMGSPDLQGEEKLEYLVRGMKRYEYAGVDFLEINESCPNTAHGKPQDNDLKNRLQYLKEHFLDQRTISDTDKIRQIPVIVKFSNDTERNQIPFLLDILFELRYDGVNFGNTSTQYQKRRKNIHPSEQKLYDHFTQIFGGGVSGKPLKESSLELAGTEVEYLKKGSPSQEFHVIRTGGIESKRDLEDSERAGISLNQWFTGYFENFAKYGNNIYKQILS